MMIRKILDAFKKHRLYYFFSLASLACQIIGLVMSIYSLSIIGIIIFTCQQLFDKFHSDYFDCGEY
jgi:hypothetical protein